MLSSDEITICVPDVLGGAPDAVESLLSRISIVEAHRPVILDLTPVNWICPYGAVILLSTCRSLHQRTGRSVRLAGLQQDIHAYLRRIDFFERIMPAAFTSDPFNPVFDYGRSPASSNVLELAPIMQPADVYIVAERARQILNAWLVGSTHDTNQIVRLLSEACSNVVDHSQDMGMAIIQKYHHPRFVKVELAICDLGLGIRGSLVAAHGEVAASCAGYIHQALQGLSARPGGHIGQGLGAIQQIVVNTGGSLFVRSETGHVLVQQGGMLSSDDLPYFPRTQIAITFRANLVG